MKSIPKRWLIAIVVFMPLLNFCQCNDNSIKLNGMDVSRRELMEALLKEESGEDSLNVELESSIQDAAHEGFKAESHDTVSKGLKQIDFSSISILNENMFCSEMDGTVLVSFPEKCLQLICKYGFITTSYLDDSDQCNCCEYAGHLFKEGDELPGVCVKMFCCDGQWVSTDLINDCCDNCDVFGDPHIITFDAKSPMPGAQWYPINTICNYTLTQSIEPMTKWGDDTYPAFAVHASFGHCWGTMESTCLEAITIRDNEFTVLELSKYALKEVKLNDQVNILTDLPTTLVDGFGKKHPVMMWKIGLDCVRYLGSQGLMIDICPLYMRIFAHPSLMGDIGGLCGYYNDYYHDDYITRHGMPTDTAFYPQLPTPHFIYSWLSLTNDHNYCNQEIIYPFVQGGYSTMFHPTDIYGISSYFNSAHCAQPLAFAQINNTCASLMVTNSTQVNTNLFEACIYDACKIGTDNLPAIVGMYRKMIYDLQSMEVVSPSEYVEPPCMVDDYGNSVVTVTVTEVVTSVVTQFICSTPVLPTKPTPTIYTPVSTTGIHMEKNNKDVNKKRKHI